MKEDEDRIILECERCGRPTYYDEMFAWFTRLVCDPCYSEMLKK